MTRAMRLTAAGFVATAVTFGPGRMGFGLFLPAFREDFALTTATAGLIASGGFLAFLVGLLASAGMARHYSARASVVTGAICALVGFVIVAAAFTPMHLAIGIALAGSSAGLCWAPFNDAAERIIAPEARPTALSVISTGTTFGVAGAAVLAFLVIEGVFDWRGAWIGFAVSSVALTGFAVTGLPPGGWAAPARGPLHDSGGAGISAPIEPAPEPAHAASESHLLRREVMPLYATALCFGMTNAVFLSFAADRVVAAGGLPGLADSVASVVIFLGYGVFGVLGLLTGRLEARIGLAALFCLIFSSGALSLVLIGIAPTSWSAVIAASGLHGMAIMMVSAVFSFWSVRLFPGRSTLGFTAALLSVAAGSVIGPALAGLLAAAQGPGVMFLVAALPSLTAAAWFAVLLLRERPRLPPAPPA